MIRIRPILLTVILFTSTLLYSCAARNAALPQNVSELNRLNFPDYVWDISYSTDGEYFGLTVGNNSRYLYEKNWNLVWSRDGDERFWGGPFIISPNGKTALFGRLESKGDIAVVNISDQKIIQCPSEHANWVTDLSFNKNGDILVSAGWEGAICVWSYAGDTLEMKQRFEPDTRCLWCAEISADGKYIAAGDIDGVLNILKREKDGYVDFKRPHRHTSGIRDIAFSKNSSEFVTASEDGTALIWKINGESLEEVQLLTGHRGPVNAVAYSSDGRFIATGGKDMTIRIWKKTGNFYTQVNVLYGHSDEVLRLEFHPKLNQFASCSDDKSVAVWSIMPPEK